jgi:hypothetical protein
MRDIHIRALAAALIEVQRNFGVPGASCTKLSPLP